jgi:endonuclease YncB( thermonuclease family)
VFTNYFRGLLYLFLAILLASCSNKVVLIDQVIDGDTVVTSNGERVRLVQIDSPEMSSGECYALESKNALDKILKPYMISSRTTESDLKTLEKENGVKVEQDSNLDSIDRYGRQLAYLYVGNMNVNIELVRIGAAAPYFYQGSQGAFAEELKSAADFARGNQLGIWKSCPGFSYDPTKSIETGYSTTVSQAVLLGSRGDTAALGKIQCSPDYRECVPPYPPDYDCGDLVNLGLIHVLGSDPHRLDRDGDGLACESNAR